MERPELQRIDSLAILPLGPGPTFNWLSRTDSRQLSAVLSDRHHVLGPISLESTQSTSDGRREIESRTFNSVYGDSETRRAVTGTAIDDSKQGGTPAITTRPISERLRERQTVRPEAFGLGLDLELVQAGA